MKDDRPISPDEPPQKRKRHRIPPATTARARALRKVSPFPERLLWSRLRGGKLGGLRFRRQYPIDRYFADFCCPSRRLVVELDGTSHVGREEYDARRTRLIEARDFRVIRFSDDAVIRNIGGVVARIRLELGLGEEGLEDRDKT